MRLAGGDANCVLTTLKPLFTWSLLVAKDAISVAPASGGTPKNAANTTVAAILCLVKKEYEWYIIFAGG